MKKSLELDEKCLKLIIKQEGDNEFDLYIHTKANLSVLINHLDKEDFNSLIKLFESCLES